MIAYENQDSILACWLYIHSLLIYHLPVEFEVPTVAANQGIYLDT